MVEGSSHMWQLRCMVITTKWWRGVFTCGSCARQFNMHSNYYYMVEGSPHVWLTCTVINVQGDYYMVEGSPHVWLTCAVINVQGDYYMVEGSPHMWLTCTVINVQGDYYMVEGSPHVAINMHGNYYYMVEGSVHVWLTCGN